MGHLVSLEEGVDEGTRASLSALAASASGSGSGSGGVEGEGKVVALRAFTKLILSLTPGQDLGYKFYAIYNVLACDIALMLVKLQHIDPAVSDEVLFHVKFSLSMMERDLKEEGDATMEGDSNSISSIDSRKTIFYSRCTQSLRVAQIHNNRGYLDSISLLLEGGGITASAAAGSDSLRNKAMLQRSVDRLTSEMPAFAKSITRLKMASLAPIDFLHDGARRGFSPLELLDVVQMWLKDRSFHIEDRHYVAVLDAMGPARVHPNDVSVLITVMDHMRVQGVSSTFLFYSKFVEIVTDPYLEGKELLVKSIPESLMNYCALLFGGNASTWIEALSLHISSSMMKDGLYLNTATAAAHSGPSGEGGSRSSRADSFDALDLIRKLRLSLYTIDTSYSWATSPHIVYQEKWGIDCPANFVVRYMSLPTSIGKDHNNVTAYKTYFQCLANSSRLESVEGNRSYIEDIGLRRRYCWDGSNHKDVEEYVSRQNESHSGWDGGHFFQLGDIASLLETSKRHSFKTFEASSEDPSFLYSIAARWGVLRSDPFATGLVRRGNVDLPLSDPVSVPLERVRLVWDHMISSKVEPDAEVCAEAITAHTEITVKHSLVLVSALSIVEYALRRFPPSALPRVFEEAIACAFRHDNNQVADRLLEKMLEVGSPLENGGVAVSFIEHLGIKAPITDPPAAYEAYRGFTTSLGVPVSSKVSTYLFATSPSHSFSTTAATTKS
jgi:hypothetical protein